jgi:hypothetical protein
MQPSLSNKTVQTDKELYGEDMRGLIKEAVEVYIILPLREEESVVLNIHKRNRRSCRVRRFF